MLEVKKQLLAFRIKAIEYAKGMSTREKTIVAALALVVGLSVTYSIAERILVGLGEQDRRVEMVAKELELLPRQLEVFKGLQARKDSVEKLYEKVQFKEGVVAHLENLIKNTAKVTTEGDYNISSKATAEIGGRFERTSLTVTLFTNQMANLVEFLKLLAEGERPLVVDKLAVVRQKRRGVDQLGVDLSVSSFSRLGTSEPPPEKSKS